MTSYKLNRVFLYGYITTEPKIRMGTDGGTGNANFQLGVESTFIGKDGKKKVEKMYIPISTFLSPIFPYLKKGKRLIVQGRLRKAVFIGKDGNECEYYSVLADEISFMGGDKELYAEKETNTAVDLEGNRKCLTEERNPKSPNDFEEEEMPF